jgi:hypothetical protein
MNTVQPVENGQIQDVISKQARHPFEILYEAGVSRTRSIAWKGTLHDSMAPVSTSSVDWNNWREDRPFRLLNGLNRRAYTSRVSYCYNKVLPYLNFLCWRILLKVKNILMVVVVSSCLLWAQKSSSATCAISLTKDHHIDSSEWMLMRPWRRWVMTLVHASWLSSSTVRRVERLDERSFAWCNGYPSA